MLEVVRSFLGLAGYYRRFIKYFKKLAYPLFWLLAKDSEFVWSKTCQETLDTLKDKLTIASILRGPNWALPFHIHADASQKAIRVALGWIDKNFPYAIYFISKSLSKAELNYIVTKKELLAIVHSLNKFRHYITGYQTVVHTNHAGIKYLMNKPNVNAQTIRWSLLLQQFDLTIVDKPNKKNVVADFMSRLTLSAGKRKIVRKSAPFTWIGGNLFKLGPDQILRRCVREGEVFDILLTCHDGPCGGHFATKRTTFKVLQVGYYWPTLHQDVKRYTSQCDQCQRMGKPTPRDEMPLQPQLTFKPFDKWGMDFIVPIDPPSKQKQYIIVCTDYLTKWVETKAIKANIGDKVVEFLRENVYYNFGYPRELVTDQGS
eukprot:PITA_09892